MSWCGGSRRRRPAWNESSWRMRHLATAALRRIEWLTLVLGGAGAAWAAGAGDGAGSAAVALGAGFSVDQFSLAEGQRAGVWRGGHGAGGFASRCAFPCCAYLKFFGRFVLLLGVVYVILSRSWLPAVAVLGGLFAARGGGDDGADVRIARERRAARHTARRAISEGPVGVELGRPMEEQDPGYDQAGQRAVRQAGAWRLLARCTFSPSNSAISDPQSHRHGTAGLSDGDGLFLWLQGAALRGAIPAARSSAWNCC